VTNYLTANPSEFGEALQSALERVNTNYEPPYVASFSRAPDSLPLWRSYCPNGNGVSIGFRVSALMNSGLTHNPPNKHLSWNSVIRPVEYLDFNDFERQDAILDDCLSVLDWYHIQRDRAPQNVVFRPDENFLMQEVARRACAVKHPGFQAEQEVRLIASRLFLNGATLKFRFSRTTVIPYVEVLMPPEPETPPTSEENTYFIHHVIVGPTPNPDLTSEAVKLMFEAQGGDAAAVLVLKSDIP